MLQAYSTNVTVDATSAIPFSNVAVQKGRTAKLSSTNTIELDKCGVYMITANASTDAATTIQLYVNEVAQPQAQSVGTTMNFSSLIQVREDNCNCDCYSSPTVCQIRNTGSASTTFTNINVVVTKIC